MAVMMLVFVVTNKYLKKAVFSEQKVLVINP